MKLSSKVALVTGAGSGIGRAVVKLFLEEGAQVVASDLVPAGLETLASEIPEAARSRLVTVTGNVANRAEAEAMVDAAVKAYGTIDIVVNNAGIMDEFMPLGNLQDEMWRQVMSVNLDGRCSSPAKLCKSCCRRKKA